MRLWRKRAAPRSEIGSSFYRVLVKRVCGEVLLGENRGALYEPARLEDVCRTGI